MLIIIGILLGLALYFDKNTDYELNTTTFFLVLLPPIILDAGYFMPARPFFDQLGKSNRYISCVAMCIVSLCIYRIFAVRIAIGVIEWQPELKL